MNIKDLDDDVARRLEEQAAAAGLSVQQHLRNELTRIASRCSPAEFAQGREPMGRAEFLAIRQRLRDPGHRAAVIDRSYQVFDDVPLDTEDEWGNLAEFL